MLLCASRPRACHTPRPSDTPHLARLHKQASTTVAFCHTSSGQAPHSIAFHNQASTTVAFWHTSYGQAPHSIALHKQYSGLLTHLIWPGSTQHSTSQAIQWPSDTPHLARLHVVLHKHLIQYPMQRTIINPMNTGTISQANFWEMGWSAYGLFQVHRYHLELNWTTTYLCMRSFSRCASCSICLWSKSAILCRDLSRSSFSDWISRSRVWGTRE